MTSAGTRDVVRIGVVVGTEVARIGSWEIPAAVTPISYTRSIERAGAAPILFPTTDMLAEHPELMLDVVDAVVLAGGRDVDPSCYGAVRHPRTEASDDLRDKVELAVIRAALDRDMPVLAICRGMQLINIALGGTIDQHLPDRLGHDDHAGKPGAFGQHEINVIAGTRLAAAYKHRNNIGVHTYHHQAVNVLGVGLVPTAYSNPDRVVEAIESTAHSYVLGVQWHPEQDDATPLFQSLVDHVRERTEVAAVSAICGH
ncbi:gamma-glutamyl-gamma-aminobutyrate hydrolase family protein [Paenarthrobacter sp. NEAU-H11]|uniref:gamma-glutamyl-gamma-aminobutyrate hydrolase family protein n=1 Tax=Paenarthrobacter sp. NEAU-H11 TaxID=3423924 RepID=UPI003D333E77